MKVIFLTDIMFPPFSCISLGTRKADFNEKRALLPGLSLINDIILLRSDFFDFLDFFFIKGETLSAARGAFGVAVSASGEVGKGDRSDHGGDAKEDQTPITVTHPAPVLKPSVLRNEDPVLRRDDGQVVSDDAKDHEREACQGDDSRNHVPGEFFPSELHLLFLHGLLLSSFGLSSFVGLVGLHLFDEGIDHVGINGVEASFRVAEVEVDRFKNIALDVREALAGGQIAAADAHFNKSVDLVFHILIDRVGLDRVGADATDVADDLLDVLSNEVRGRGVGTVGFVAGDVVIVEEFVELVDEGEEGNRAEHAVFGKPELERPCLLLSRRPSFARRRR